MSWIPPSTGLVQKSTVALGLQFSLTKNHYRMRALARNQQRKQWSRNQISGCHWNLRVGPWRGNSLGFDMDLSDLLDGWLAGSLVFQTWWLNNPSKKFSLPWETGWNINGCCRNMCNAKAPYGSPWQRDGRSGDVHVAGLGKQLVGCTGYIHNHQLDIGHWTYWASQVEAA